MSIGFVGAYSQVTIGLLNNVTASSIQLSAPRNEKYGYPELTERAKRKILGLNSAKLYDIKTLDTGACRPVPKDYESRMSDKPKTILEVGQLKADNMSQMKETTPPGHRAG